MAVHLFFITIAIENILKNLNRISKIKQVGRCRYDPPYSTVGSQDAFHRRYFTLLTWSVGDPCVRFKLVHFVSFHILISPNMVSKYFLYFECNYHVLDENDDFLIHGRRGWCSWCFHFSFKNQDTSTGEICKMCCCQRPVLEVEKMYLSFFPCLLRGSVSVSTSARPESRWAMPAGSCTVWNMESSPTVRCPVTRPLD